MLRPSFVPPPAFRTLRDLTRYRADLVAARTAEEQRAEKLLEDACIKVSVVVSDLFGASGRDMMAALVAGERNPKALAQLARRRMRSKIGVLEEAFTGHFTDHHAFLLARMLARVDAISTDITDLDTRIGAEITPFAEAVARLDEIPGINLAAAQAIIAEIGMHTPPGSADALPGATTRHPGVVIFRLARVPHCWPVAATGDHLGTTRHASNRTTPHVATPAAPLPGLD